MKNSLIVFFQKISQGILGVITLYFVLKYMDTDQQGYYYAFGSILSFYIVLDLGLSGLLVQLSAKYYSGVINTNDFDEPPKNQNKLTFLEFINWTYRSYFKKSFSIFFLIPIGYIYFVNATKLNVSNDWIIPWIYSVLALLLNYISMPILSVIEGIGNIIESYTIRLIYYLLGCVGAWILIFNNHGLYAFSFNYVIASVIILTWSFKRYKNIIRQTKNLNEYKFFKKEEINNIQKKVAFTTVANYIFLNIPILIAFYFIDAATAGRLGIAFVVGNLIGSFSSSILISNTPLITKYIVENKYLEARKIFINTFKYSIILMIFFYMIIIYLFSYLESYYPNKLVKPSEFILILITFIVFHGVALLSSYFRAHGNELLSEFLCISTVLSMIISSIAASYFGSVGIILSMLIVYGAINIVNSLYHWVRLDKKLKYL